MGSSRQRGSRTCTLRRNTLRPTRRIVSWRQLCWPTSPGPRPRAHHRCCHCGMHGAPNAARVMHAAQRQMAASRPRNARPRGVHCWPAARDGVALACGACCMARGLAPRWTPGMRPCRVWAGVVATAPPRLTGPSSHRDSGAVAAASGPFMHSHGLISSSWQPWAAHSGLGRTGAMFGTRLLCS